MSDTGICYFGGVAYSEGATVCDNGTLLICERDGRWAPMGACDNTRTPDSPQRGISVHVGINRIDPAHYGTSGQLAGCENDARAMEAIARAAGFSTSSLLTTQATTRQVVAAISKAATELSRGDLFFLSYAGHGSQVNDTNNDEDDRSDETWCLYDRMLVDDEIYRLFAQFRAGVRILVISDSCHSGTVARAMVSAKRELRSFLECVSPANATRDLDSARFRTLDPVTAERVYQSHRAIYDGIQNAGPGSEAIQIPASLILLSGCQDSQTSLDGAANGLFTERLLHVWGNGRFNGTYQSLCLKVRELMPPTQVPNYFTAGTRDHDFDAMPPFRLRGRDTRPAAADPSIDDLLAALDDLNHARERVLAMRKTDIGHEIADAFDRPLKANGGIRRGPLSSYV